jgi:uncharacterized protein YwqG
MNEEIAKLLKPLAKPATKLNLTKVKNLADLPVAGTHFGGPPYAEAGDDYPLCPTCHKPLNFICQIDARRGFHEKPEGISLFTFFYCWECFPWGFKDDQKGQWVVRNYNQPREDKFVGIEPPAEILYPTEPCLADEEKITVFPNWEEINNLSVEISNAVDDIESEDPWEEYDSIVKELGGFKDFATTIGGYPFWVQGAETLECDLCGNRMKLLAQIDSEEKANLGWGDCGLVYLFFCENHPLEIKFILQCF